jgi:glycerol-3-phosphate dehydrogenase (NAD(P)+)
VTVCGVLGAGSWGTTLADLLARRGHGVTIWAYEAEVVEQINRDRSNELFLPGCTLHGSLRAVTDPREAVRGAELVLSASPSHAARGVLRQVAGALDDGALLVSATKGIETDTLSRMSEVAAEVLPTTRFVVLSGPSFAAEVYAGQPTAVVAAARDEPATWEVQRAFSSPRFRVYSNRDVVGAELAGALKNVIAIAAGILEGLGMGHNPRAALLTRGLAEITRLGVALGADPLTFAGLAGMGDLVLTAYGGLSRNRTLGEALGRGERLEEYLAGQRTVAEGVNTTRAAIRLAERAGVEMPITAKVGEVLFEGKDPRRGIGELMERALKAEQWGAAGAGGGASEGATGRVGA